MGLPKVDIQLQNGALGLTAGSADGVAALVMSGVAVAGKIALNEVKQIFSTQDAKDLGLDEAYDTANGTAVWKNIKDFYAEAGEGAELYIMLYVNTTTMATVCDTASDLLKKVLNAGAGRIRIAAVMRIPDGMYAAAPVDQLDPDVIAAAGKAHALGVEFATAYKPVRTLIDGRDYQGTAGTLLDLKLSNYNRSAVVLGTDKAVTKTAAVGLVLGRLAGKQVQRNIGRVKDGALAIDASYLTDGTAIEDLTNATLDIIHDKGFIFMRKYQGKNGYFFNDDPTATAATDDYSSIARGRVIDKALTIAYTTYVEEILDDLEVDPDTGFLNAAVAKSYQAKIEKAIEQEMLLDGEISGVNVVIDPEQNVVSTGKVAITLNIIPKTYGKTIEVKLGFENPANA